jgi:hypothetical protein
MKEYKIDIGAKKKNFRLNSLYSGFWYGYSQASINITFGGLLLLQSLFFKEENLNT